MKKFLKAFWKIFRSNLVLKIVAVLFAVILWSYVLSVVNPPRERVISDVQITLNTESLMAKNLAISTDLSDIPKTVNIRVKVNQNDVKNLSNQNVQAYIDLSGINEAGTYIRDIKPSTTYGQALKVSPSQVTLHVDKNVTRQVPVKYNPVGSVEAGYYADTPSITDIINIQGAMTDVQKVVSARCTVDLNGLTQGFSKSYEVELLDAGGSVVDPGLFPGLLPSVIVNLSVLPVKTVDVDVAGSIIGQDSLAPGYEIIETKCSPEKVRIVGEKSLLDGIDSIKLLPFSVAGSKTDVIMTPPFAPPEGIRVLDVEKAEVGVYIREKTDQKTYKSVAIKTRNLSPGLVVSSIDPSSVDVTVLAGVTELSKLLRADIAPFVDLDGLTEGTYNLKVYFVLPDGFAAENFTPSAVSVNVTIKKR